VSKPRSLRPRLGSTRGSVVLVYEARGFVNSCRICRQIGFAGTGAQRTPRASSRFAGIDCPRAGGAAESAFYGRLNPTPNIHAIGGSTRSLPVSSRELQPLWVSRIPLQMRMIEFTNPTRHAPPLEGWRAIKPRGSCPNLMVARARETKKEALATRCTHRTAILKPLRSRGSCRTAPPRAP
jgi:hypothetical protein